MRGYTACRDNLHKQFCRSVLDDVLGAIVYQVLHVLSTSKEFKGTRHVPPLK